MYLICQWFLPDKRVVFAELILSGIDCEKDEILRSRVAEAKSRMETVNQGRAKLMDFEGLYNEG